MDMTLTRTGPAHPQDVWLHYHRLGLWTEWAPHLTRVRADSTVLLPGIEGTVTALGLVPVRFRILSVEPDRHRWSWRVRLGPVAMELEHDVAPAPDGGTRANITIHGPAAVLLAYRPLMGWALSRLVRVGPPR
ncbi:SRPBCC family protein [Kocuria tytonis]|uniref:SRPBCC family protein n=1 Tax=Kocuria tytonis TaxID=2054280 RepID=A0A495A2L5_9MICC|nr:SRPBCC family protein [Kocuria tytonis]RKQ33767.1 SRPBCC family protein [Kocuria tytonis]